MAGAHRRRGAGDVVVVTSKVVSKVEGRLITVPADPPARDAARRELVAAETQRVLARHGRTLITQNWLGVVQAASGVDASNVERHEVALLPVDPDASAARLRARLAAQLGVDVAVVITDTMGRAWRVGQTDAAIEPGRAAGRADAVLLRRSVRCYRPDPVDPELLRRAVAVALRAPAPHHTRPVRFVWLADRSRRRRLLDAMAQAWRTDLRGDGMPEDRIEHRVRRGKVLYDAPEVL